MSIVSELLPLSRVESPTDQAQLAALVREAAASRTPIYPIGGGTSLDYGLPPRAPGIGLSLTGLSRVVDYPARDMTITAEAGITMAALAELLATERQWLPIEAALPERATLGGVIATNASGPRRYGYGTMRDYVIGISAVDGRGTPFHGGGRVVKNVAGYDFCKLLTGSLGTLGIITQVTLKVRPIPEASVLVVSHEPNFEAAEARLEALVNTKSSPVAIELIAGSAWDAGWPLSSAPSEHACSLIVGLEGTRVEVDWMTRTLLAEWQQQGAGRTEAVAGEATAALWKQLVDFPADPSGAMTIKATLRPSAVVEFARAAQKLEPECSLQAHAGNGVVLVRFGGERPELVALLRQHLLPIAQRAAGTISVLQGRGAWDQDAASYWGSVGGSLAYMQAVKSQFDPHGLLNPGRFVYE